MPGQYAADYTAVLIATVLGTVMVLVSFMMSTLLAPKARSAMKAIPFECGIQPTGKNWPQMHFRYYLFAILFLIFDVEAVFLFPWAVIFLGSTTVVFVEMIIFIGVLFFGLLYGWRKGVLQWR